MSKTALVHPSTAKLPPEEQRTGTYTYTSPEEYAARNCFAVHVEPKQAVRWACIEKDDRCEHTCAPHSVGMNPAIAASYGAVGQSAPVKKIIRKAAPTLNDPLQALRDIAHIAATSLPDEEAYNLLVVLANRFGMEIDNG